MSKFYPTTTWALTVALLVTSAFADTVTLKSGEHLEGKITKETDKDVTIEVQISAGIVDERVVPKAQIEKIDKMSAELQAFHAIERIQVQPNSLEAAQYEPYVAALQGYVTQFPNSPRTADVQATLKAFEDEAKRVEGGEVKMNGQWLNKTEVEKEKVQINGRLAFNYMQAESSAGDYVGALNAFAALEKTYPGAAVVPDAIDLAKKIIPALKTELDRAIPEQKVLQTQRTKGLKAASPGERAEMQAAIKKEDAAAEAAATAAEAGGRWAPLLKHNLKCLTQLMTRANKEEPRLAALKVGDMRHSVQLAEAAQKSLASGNTEEAVTTLKQATALWSANELANRLTKSITEKKGTTSAAAPVSAAPETTPTPATPKPAPAKMTPKPKASTPRPSAAVQTATPAAAAPAVAAAQKDAEDDKPFYMTLPGAAAIVVGLSAVLAGANVFVKIKKRKAEQAQFP